MKDLPAKTVISVEIELGATQRRAYVRAEEAGVIWLRQLGRDVSITNVLELITRLKQLCNFCPETGESAKLDNLRDRLAELEMQNNRAIVFSQFTDDVFGVERIAVGLARFRPQKYTGTMSQDERMAVLRMFNAPDTKSPLILSLRAGGQGLNLQAASYVFHFDRWWNPAVERQAEDRTHRFGQTQPVTVYTYTCAKTIEERIAAIIAAKGALFRGWVDEINEVGADVRAALTEDELFGLFGLAPPRSPKDEAASEPVTDRPIT